jgi:hypothetical protein
MLAYDMQDIVASWAEPKQFALPGTELQQKLEAAVSVMAEKPLEVAKGPIAAIAEATGAQEEQVVQAAGFTGLVALGGSVIVGLVIAATLGIAFVAWEALQHNSHRYPLSRGKRNVRRNAKKR